MAGIPTEGHRRGCVPWRRPELLTVGQDAGTLPSYEHPPSGVVQPHQGQAGSKPIKLSPQSLPAWCSG